MRVLLAFLLCLAIPLQGFANTHVFASQPCPMEQSVHQAMSVMANMNHDCCNDEDTAAKTGHACKTGQECSLTQACMALPVIFSAGLPTATYAVPPPRDRLWSFDPTSVWRPPTLS